MLKSYLTVGDALDRSGFKLVSAIAKLSRKQAKRVRDCPLDSGYGDACAEAIAHAVALRQSIREAFGEPPGIVHPRGSEHERNIAAALADTIAVYVLEY